MSYCRLLGVTSNIPYLNIKDCFDLINPMMPNDNSARIKSNCNWFGCFDSIPWDALCTAPFLFDNPVVQTDVREVFFFFLLPYARHNSNFYVDSLEIFHYHFWLVYKDTFLFFIIYSLCVFYFYIVILLSNIPMQIAYQHSHISMGWNRCVLYWLSDFGKFWIEMNITCFCSKNAK